LANHNADTIRLVHELAGKTSQRQIAKIVNLTKGQVQHILDYEKPTPKEFCVIRLPTPLDLTGDFMVVGDVHVPYTDYDFAQLVGRVDGR